MDPSSGPGVPSSVGERGPARVILSAASHSAVWAGLYVVAAVVSVVQVAGVDASATGLTRGRALLFSFCTATAVYLLDRVKVRDAWLDPADAAAHPARFEFVRRYAVRVRLLMAVLLIAAAGTGSRLLTFGWVIPLVAAAGVWFYAGRPRAERARPKDIVLLKNTYVALGITGFAMLVTLAVANPLASVSEYREFVSKHFLPLAVAGMYLAVRVFADAALCDLDDAEADRRFGTRTLAVEFGRRRAWNIGLGLRVLASTVLVFLPVVPLGPRVAWAAVTIASSLLLRWLAPVHVRDWVDARFALEALIVSCILVVVQ